MDDASTTFRVILARSSWGGCTSRAGGTIMDVVATAEAERQSRIARTGGVMYGVVTDVPAPVELYDAAHAAVGRRSGAKIEGLLVHIGRSTSSGFQVIEVWESREHFDRYNREVVGPVMADLAQGQPAPAVPPPVEFDVRGLVIPAANIYH